MDTDYHELYNEYFYARHITGMSDSAKIILSLIYEHYSLESVIDVGCGQGAWLKLAESLGSKTLKGIDGDWVNTERLLSKNIEFTAVKLNNSKPTINRKYDLCISLEVAEHLSEDNAENFVQLLCEE